MLHLRENQLSIKIKKFKYKIPGIRPKKKELKEMEPHWIKLIKRRPQDEIK